MATPKPGEIRCPHCHRSTPPAAYCTQCGQPIPSDARARPRGMDRDELEERIRARRSGGEPYRRGVAADDEFGYERFEPDPLDAQARREAQGEPGAVPPRVDRFAEPDEAPPRDEPPVAPPVVPPVAPPPDITREPEPDRWERWSDPQAAPRQPVEPPAPPPPHVAAAEPPPGPRGWPPPPVEAPIEDDDLADYPYPEPYAYEERDRSGLGGGAIIGFLALGVAALLGGALLAGLFGGDGGVGAARPTPSATAPPTETAVPTPEPTVAGSPGATGSPGPGESPATGDGPVTFGDGALYQVQPCATSEMDFDGCTVDGSNVTSDQMWTWIGFSDADGGDTVVLSLESGGQTIAQQEIVVGQTVNCPGRCTGYLIRGFRGLFPGEYELVLERNGDFAHRSPFRVEG